MPMAHLAHSGLETLSAEYPSLGPDSPAIEKLIPVCSVHQTEFNTWFSFAGCSLQFPVLGDK